MNRHKLFLWSVLSLIILSSLLMAGCGPPPGPTLTPLPTATSTPRSTPLPEVATAVPLASEENVLTLLMLPQADADEADAAAEALAARILELKGLHVDVQLVESYGQIVAALCSAEPAAGWLDGLSFMAAAAQDCADPALAIERNRDTGYQLSFVMNVDYVGNEPDENDIARLANEPLCRVEGEPLWPAAELLLRSGGVNPLYDLEAIVDMEDYAAVVNAVYEGDCVAGIVPGGYFPRQARSALRDIDNLTDRVALIKETAEIPFAVLAYPQTVPLNVRIPLSDVFMEINADEENAAMISTILQYDDLERVDAADFEVFFAFMQSTGLDFAVLGE